MNVKLTRIKMGLTQRALADIVGVSPATMVRIEKNDIDGIRVGTLREVAKVLNTTVQELFFN